MTRFVNPRRYEGKYRDSIDIGTIDYYYEKKPEVLKVSSEYENHRNSFQEGNWFNEEFQTWLRAQEQFVKFKGSYRERFCL